MMDEQKISFETAKLAKEKGFVSSQKEIYYNPMTGFCKYEEVVPTQFILQKWLREEHYLSVELWYDTNGAWLGTPNVWGAQTYHMTKTHSDREAVYSPTYEEAFEKELYRALTLIK